MNTDHKKKEIAGLFLHVLYLIFMTSIVFSSRAVSSISIVAIFVTQLIINKPAIFPPFKSKFQLLFLSGCILLFLLQLVALLYTNDTQKGWSNIRIKTGLLITPLALFTSSLITATDKGKATFPLLHCTCHRFTILSWQCLYQVPGGSGFILFFLSFISQSNTSTRCLFFSSCYGGACFPFGKYFPEHPSPLPIISYITYPILFRLSFPARL